MIRYNTSEKYFHKNWQYKLFWQTLESWCTNLQKCLLTDVYNYQYLTNDFIHHKQNRQMDRPT